MLNLYQELKVTKMKYAEIKSKTNDELKKIYVDYKKKLYNLGTRATLP